MRFTTAMSRPFLTTSAVARILQVADGTVRQMARRGELPSVSTEGGVRLFNRAEVERLAVERAKRRPEPPTPEAA
jgi:excisionase family DNA binding protein